MNRTAKLLIIEVVVLSVITMLVSPGFLIKKPAVVQPPEVAVMRIDLNDVTLTEIFDNGKEVKYEGNNLKLESQGETFDFTDVQIKGRGNSTWSGLKRPFQIKFKEKVNLLGLGARKKYILLANARDHSLIRNTLMVDLAEMLEMNYGVRGEFVELFIDGDYQGLYYLTTKIEIGKNGVDLRDKYGVIFEYDDLNNKADTCYYSVSGGCLILKDAVFEDDEEIKTKAVEDFMAEFDKLSLAAKKGDFAKVSEVIDVRSFAEYFLISEFAVNPDAYVSSFYFYKDGKSDKIHAGPLWDHDYAFANREWVWASHENFYSPTEMTALREHVFSEKRKNTDKGKLLYYLAEMPEFREEVRKVFQEKMSGREWELKYRMIKEVLKIQEAALRDDKKWQKEPTFLKEIEYLYDWLDQRFDCFEREYGKKKIEIGEPIEI